MVFQTHITRCIVAFLFGGAMAVTWDAWWHGAIGRESFWIPPHLLLYTSVIGAIGVAFYGWYRTKEKAFKMLTFILFFIPLSAPFDELWHRLFGVEKLTSPFVIWSPPHLTGIGAAIAGFVLLLFLIRQDKDILSQRFFGGLVFAGLLSALLLLAQPFFPTGPFALLGFWGAGIFAAVLSGILLIGQTWIPGIAGATVITLFFIGLHAMGFHTGEVVVGVLVSPHAHAPSWLMIFSFLIPAVFLDLIQKSPLWVRGMIAGLLWGGVLYAFSSAFFAPEFQYTAGDVVTAIFASFVGGFVGGILANLLGNKISLPARAKARVAQLEEQSLRKR